MYNRRPNVMFGDKQDGIHSQGPMPPPWRFMYLRETKSWRWEEEKGGGGEKKSV